MPVETTASVANGKLRLKKAQLRPLTFGEIRAEGMVTDLTTPCWSQQCPAPDTYKQCPSCSQYCSSWCA